MILQPRWYQADAVNSVFNYFAAGNTGNPVIAMPTATGKSVVIAGLIWQAMQSWPYLRVMMLTHDERLIEQNAKKLKELWPMAPVGICCAGLGQKETRQAVIYGSLKTAANIIQKANECAGPHFGHVDLIIIDECHLVSPNEETQYRYIIEMLLLLNPNLKIIGLTATPYRLKLGHITKNGIFTDVCYDCTDVNSYNKLIEEGFLCPVIPKSTDLKINLEGVRRNSSGDYRESDLNEITDKILVPAIKEMIELSAYRRCGLIFTPSIDTCVHTAEIMQSFGMNAIEVHSKLKKKDCADRIKAYKAGEYKYIINKDMLTTGFDHPPIDFIGNLRATDSPGLWVQMVGRGARPFDWYSLSLAQQREFAAYEGLVKRNTLVMDFAANTARLGPVNDPVLPREPGKGGGTAPVWVCPNKNCQAYNHAAARFCIACGLEHVFQVNYSTEAASDQLIKGLENDEVKIEFYAVSHVVYEKHIKTGKPPCLKVTYFCGSKSFKEFVFFESGVKYIQNQARNWWQQRHFAMPPFNTDEALSLINELRKPQKIKVEVSGKYPQILGAEW